MGGVRHRPATARLCGEGDRRDRSEGERRATLAKAKDIALLRLRRDLPRYAPDVVAHFGLAGAPDTNDTEYYDDGGDAGNETDDKMVE